MTEENLKLRIEQILNKSIEEIDFTSIIQALQILDLNIGVYSIGTAKIMTSNKTINIKANQSFTQLNESDKVLLLELFLK